MMMITEPISPPERIRSRRAGRFKAMLVSHNSRLSARKFKSQMASIYTTKRIPPVSASNEPAPPKRPLLPGPRARSLRNAAAMHAVSVFVHQPGDVVEGYIH
ncbi:hypothetical protein BCO26_1026 [Heyndrickxia coagulans 2-6]|nr:hypothetical protein BCO26_1026 [Heyndrickxia coagulans 2-6]